MPESKVGQFSRDVCVVGGGGHIGLPLALTFCDVGYKTVVYDINQKTVDQIRRGEMPFAEEGGQEALDRAIASGRFVVDTDPSKLADCKFIVLVVGTPVDEHLNPSFTAIHKAIDSCAKYLRDGQIMILRSTIFPKISAQIQKYIRGKGLDIRVAFCPERVAQGYSLREFREMPQIISAFDPTTLAEVKTLFGRFATEFVEMEPMEAELCKLMTNAWRYLQFATVNQFYMIATDNGLDFNRILHGCRHNYPRMKGMPGPGFAAGPCLVKDTMQLAAFSHGNFVLGHAAMLVNEGLPSHLVELAKREVDLPAKTTGILGAAFKSECDDPRDSLAYKLRKLLSIESNEVLMTDPYVHDSKLVPLEVVLARSDVLFVATPHKVYKELKIPADKLVIDVWNCLRRS